MYWIGLKLSKLLHRAKTVPNLLTNINDIHEYENQNGGLTSSRPNNNPFSIINIFMS